VVGERTRLGCWFRCPRRNELFVVQIASSREHITEIQGAIGRLPEKEKSALAPWLQSPEEPVMSKAEDAALLARLDKAAVELDAGEGVPLERAREKIPGWAGK
jgi:hypothetical protein